MDLTILLIPLAVAIAPLVTLLLGRAVVLPLIVVEILLGMLLGPGGLGWVTDDAVLEGFSTLGLAMLFFMAGNDINLRAIHGAPARRASLGWGVSAVLALGAALILGDGAESVIVIAIALTGTALGSITPIVRDAGLSRGRLGAAISASGAAGEFLPLIAITVFLTGRAPVAGIAMLFVFVAAATFAFLTSVRQEHAWLSRAVTATLHTSGQFAVRLVVLLLAALVTLALALGVDYLLGAFTAGMLARVVLRSSTEAERRTIEVKLDAVAFGFFVPLFFVTTGVTFPLQQLLSDPAALALVPVFALLILIVRGIPGAWAPPAGSSWSDRRTCALLTATSLPLLIAVTQIATDNGVLEASMAAAMVGGGLVTVLLFPLLALVGRSMGEGSRSDGSVAAVTGRDTPSHA